MRRFPLAFMKGRLRDFLVLRSPFNLPPSLRDDLFEWNPSMVHFHFVHLPQAIMLARQLRKRGVPYCVTPHGGLAVEAQRRGRARARQIFGLLFERTYLNRAAFIHAISSADVEGTRAYGVRNRFIIAPNCIDPALMPRSMEFQSSVPGPAGKRLFTYIGRIDPQQKGLDMLLKAWAGILLRTCRAGLGWARLAWRARLRRPRQAVSPVRVLPRPVRTGEVGRPASADVFVHPSRWEAGVPFAVLEAMLAARPYSSRDQRIRTAWSPKPMQGPWVSPWRGTFEVP